MAKAQTTEGVALYLYIEVACDTWLAWEPIGIGDESSHFLYCFSNSKLLQDLAGLKIRAGSEMAGVGRLLWLILLKKDSKTDKRCDLSQIKREVLFHIR